jgi:hypothetical protein
MKKQRGGAWGFIEVSEVLPEANLQGELYHLCRVAGINCVLEWSSNLGRNDALILSPDCSLVMCIVECKNGRPLNPRSRQAMRYASLGVPVYGLCLLKDVDGLVRKIIEGMANGSLKGVEFGRLATIDAPFKRFRKRKFSALDLCDEINFKN